MSDFLLQSVFAIGGKTVLMGELKTGELKTQMTTIIGDKKCQILDIDAFGKHSSSFKLEDNKSAVVGLTISNIPSEEVTKYLNSIIKFQ
jgi:hypothetical protein